MTPFLIFHQTHDTTDQASGVRVEDCESEDEMAEVIRDTVVHEIGHYFGLDDETMHRIEDD